MLLNPEHIFDLSNSIYLKENIFAISSIHSIIFLPKIEFMRLNYNTYNELFLFIYQDNLTNIKFHEVILSLLPYQHIEITKAVIESSYLKKLKPIQSSTFLLLHLNSIFILYFPRFNTSEYITN